jgi:hypothetical protein
MAGINDWPGRNAAERLRQWPHIVALADAVSSPPFLGVVVLGSFARGEADDLSDVDFTVFAGEGEFDAAWEQRHRLHPADASCWDYPRRPGDRDIASHRWLTSDFVLFDGLIATPTGARLADPMHVLVGDDVLSARSSSVSRSPIRRRTDSRMRSRSMRSSSCTASSSSLSAPTGAGVSRQASSES